MRELFLISLAIFTIGYADVHLRPYQISASSAKSVGRSLPKVDLITKSTNAQETLIKILTPDVQNTEYNVAFKDLKAFTSAGPNKGMLFLH
jgi:hypothetical protein